MALLPEGITELLHHEQLSVPMIKCGKVIILTATNVIELDLQWNCLIDSLKSNGDLVVMTPFVSKCLATTLSDVEVARPLSKLCLQFPDLYVGGYRGSRKGPLMIRFEGKDLSRIEAACQSLCQNFYPGAFSETE